MTYEKISPLLPGERLSGEAATNVETAVKYEGYISRQQKAVEKMLRLEHMKIPADFDYSVLTGLLAESREKLERVRPATLGQAGRISGVTPADLQHLAVYLSERMRRAKRDNSKNTSE